MRMSPNEPADRQVSEPERRCILSGERAPKSGLTRLALGPDGMVAPDVRARAPGRGAWIGVDQITLEAALAKGKLKGALIRAFRTSAVSIPDNLGARIAANLQRATLDRLGLEARAGGLLLGGEKIEQAARGGALHALVHADDAAEDGRRKLDQAWRVGSDAEGSGMSGLVLAANRAIVGAALGRDAVVHIGLIDRAAARRVMALVTRWHGFIGRELPSWACALAEPRPSAVAQDDYVENEGR